MSQAHKNSLILDSKSLVSATNNTTFLAHYDITEHDVLGRINANSGGIFTLNNYEGRFGGGIAIEEASSNVSLLNGQNSITPWSGDGSPTLSIIDSTITFRGRKVAKFKTGSSGNCYINGSTDISTSTSSVEWTFSCYMRRVDGVPLTALSGYLYVNGNTNVNGSAILKEVEGGWYRVSYSRTGLVSGYPTLGGFFAMGSAIEYYFADWQFEPLEFPTSYIVGATTRATGILTYPASCINPLEGTISLWYYPNYPSSAVTSQANSPKVLQVGTYYGNSSMTLWSYLGAFNLYVKGVSDSGWSYTISNTGFTQYTWSMITITWSGQTWKVYKNGMLLSTGTASQSLSAIAGNIMYLGGDSIVNGTLSNGILDEFRIDNVAYSDEEILSWYVSGAPFYPKGVYTIAY